MAATVIYPFLYLYKTSGRMFDYAYKLTVFSRVQGKFTTYEVYEIYKNIIL